MSTVKFKVLLPLVLFLLFLQNVGLGNNNTQQGKIDSLRKVIESEYTKVKSSELLKLSAKYSHQDMPRALAITEIALHRARQENNLEDQFHVQRERGFIFEENNRIKAALEEFQKAEIIANALNNNTHRLTIYTDLAIVNKKLGNYKNTTDYHSSTLYLAKEIGDLEMVEDSYHGLGSVYDVVGEYEKAIEYYFKSLAIAEKRKSNRGVVITLQNISNIYLKTKNHSQALANVERAYQLSQQTQDSLIIAGVLMDYGRILAKIGDRDLALIKLNNSLRITESHQNKVAMVKCLIEIADVYTQKGLLTTAEKYISRCFDYEEYIASKDRAKLYNKLGNLEQKLGLTDKAKEYFTTSLAFAGTFENSYLSQQNNYALYEIHREQGNTALALQFLETYNKVQDEILNNEKAQRIAEKRFQFEMEASQSKIQELALSRNRTILIGLSVTLLVIITFLFFTNKLKQRNNHHLKKMNEEIQYQNKKLTESNEVLRQFAYAAAHDLKEPLRNIGSFISLIRKRYGPSLNEEANNYMEFVVNGVKRMNDLLLDLLEFSAITTEKASSDLINLRGVIDEVVYSMHDKITATNAIIDYPDVMPKVKMKRLHLVQLFQNLVSNALKFNNGKPIIKVDAQIESDKDALLITLEDNGIGMEKEFEKKIFLLFHQLDKKKGYEGTGIGLTICKNIIEKYNGHIWFESELNKGTKFYIRLPLDPTNPNPAMREARPEMMLAEAN